MLKKTILVIIFAIIFFPLVSVKAIDENAQKGAELYLEATTAMTKKDFASARAKFEEAAQYLSGKNQEDSLKMADFLGKMSPKATIKDLLKGSYFSLLGEAKEADKVWHLYNSEYDISIMHLAIAGEKPLDAVVEQMGQDLFAKQMVIKNAEGYLSKEIHSISNAASRIRMWYCDKDNTTNIVYENYNILNASSTLLLDNDMKSVSDVFKKIKCSYPSSRIAVVAALIVLAVAFIFKKRKFKNK